MHGRTPLTRTPADDAGGELLKALQGEVQAASLPKDVREAAHVLLRGLCCRLPEHLQE